MSNVSIPAKRGVVNWLSRESDYQFDKNHLTHSSDPISSIDYIMSSEIRDKWARFQIFRTEANELNNKELSIRATQLILKTCAAARGALVWDYVLQGQSLDNGLRQSLDDL